MDNNSLIQFDYQDICYQIVASNKLLKIKSIPKYW